VLRLTINPQAADAIKAMLSPTAVVVRDGERITIDADKLVPGGRWCWPCS
jgi:magnesium-transporting ATPase (P-type)